MVREGFRYVGRVRGGISARPPPAWPTGRAERPHTAQGREERIRRWRGWGWLPFMSHCVSQRPARVKRGDAIRSKSHADQSRMTGKFRKSAKRSEKALQN